jgi:DeoR/GlpR family transcriptional regulator of sugar metabolism
MPQRFLKVKEVSELLRVSNACIYRALRRGEFADAVVRFGGTLRLEEKGFLDELALMRKPRRPVVALTGRGQELTC